VKTKVSPSVVGVFVLGALLLGVVALVAFGGINLFSRPQRFTVFFDESVSGLDVGSPVKLRGVKVGRVTDIRIRYDAAKKRSEIEVACELSRNTISDAADKMINVSDSAQLPKLVDAGLRAQLGLAGLATGLLYVQLDFFEPRLYPPTRPAFASSSTVFVPAIPSAISEFQASLSELLNKLKGVDLAGLSRDLTGLIADARRQLNSVDLQPLVAESTAAATAIRTVASDPAWPATLANLNAAVTDLRGTLAKVDAQVAPTGDKLAEILAQTKSAVDAFNATALTARQFIAAQQGLGADADVAVKRLAEAADAVRRLAEFLERNPAALITGRKSGEPAASAPSPASGNPPARKP
jgi:paraquat-inducible protein B